MSTRPLLERPRRLSGRRVSRASRDTRGEVKTCEVRRLLREVQGQARVRGRGRYAQERTACRQGQVPGVRNDGNAHPGQGIATNSAGFARGEPEATRPATIQAAR